MIFCVGIILFERTRFYWFIQGHNAIKTTQVYAKIVNSELDKAMDIFND